MSTAAPHVRALLNYTVDDGRTPEYYLYQPAEPVSPLAPGTDAREMAIEDAWREQDQLSVDEEGYELHPFDPGFRDFSDAEAIARTYYPQVVEFVRRHTGAARVVVFDHTLRRRMPDDLAVQTSSRRNAVHLVHSDYTVASGPQRVRDLMGADADALLARRVAFYNVWKPLTVPVEELPLALCDARSMDAGDLLRMVLRYPDRDGEIYVMRHSPRHRWQYFPHMRPDQALLLKTYDSMTDGRARFMGHSAFEDPTTSPDARPRESIEVRTMAFF